MEKHQRFKRPWLLAALFLIPTYCMAQVTEEWVRRYDGDPSTIERAFALVVDERGNVSVTGLSQGSGTSDDYATVQYNGDGQQLWTNRYNGPGNGDDAATSIAMDSKSYIYVTGRSLGNGTGLDYATIKYDKHGRLKWVRRYNGPGNGDDEATAVATDKWGNVYVTGQCSADGFFNTDYATIKYDKQGRQQWVARYTGQENGFDGAVALAVDALGNVYVTGRSSADGSFNTDYATIKYDASGKELWVRRYNGPFNVRDEATAMALDKEGNVYVTGESFSGTNDGGNSFSNFATIKYNPAGVELWVAIFDGTKYEETRDRANDIGVDNLGNVYVTGFSGSAEEDPDNDYVTVKYDQNGVQQWVALFAGPGFEQNSSANALALDPQGNVYVTGQCAMEVGEALDFATIKYNTLGVQQWVSTYNGPSNSFDGAEDIGLDAQGNVYVTGRSRFSEFIDAGEDFVTIKYAQASNVTTSVETRNEPAASRMPTRFWVTHAPNPVVSSARIQYELPEDGYVSIQVYDALGRQVATLVNATRNAGVHYADFNAAHLQKGMHYYRITVNTGQKTWIQTRKMVIAR